MTFRYTAHQASLGIYLLLAFAAPIYAASGPTVTAMSPAPGSTLTSAPTSILVTLNSALDPASVNASAIQVARAGVDGSFGTADDVIITPTAVSVVNGNQIK